MTKNLLLLSLTLALLVGVFFLWQMEKASAPVVTPQPEVGDVPEPEIPLPEQDYSQHIEEISGNTDEVWYNIPEYGVRMKLNKEFAEDLVYKFVHDKNIREEEFDTVYFSVKSILNMVPDCSGALGAMSKGEGRGVQNESQLGYYESEYFGQLIFQFQKYFITWQGPQDACWDRALEEKVEEIFSGKKYAGPGAKNIREGMKNIEIIPQK